MPFAARFADRLRAGSLDRHCSRWALAAIGCVLLIAAAAGLVRLLPWLVAPDLPVQLAGPFATALAAAAVETAFLVGIPLGFALGAASFVERGEARALLTLGASPARIAAACWRTLASFGLLAVAVGAAWGPEADRPGDFARRLILHGRASCESATRARSVLVPVLGVNWLCFPNRPPRVAGHLPARSMQAWFTAADLRPNEDLQRFDIDDLRVIARSGTISDLKLSVHSATITGLRPWGRTASLSVIERALFIAGTAAAIAWLLTRLMLRFNVISRLHAAGAGGTAALAMLAVLHALDRTGAGLLFYWLVPVAGATAGYASLLLARSLRRIWQTAFAGRYVGPASC
jgi:hypothetical protein